MAAFAAAPRPVEPSPQKPVVVELPDGSDAIVVHPVGNLALSWDHRAVDGAYASAFIARVKEILETRDWSQEL